MAVVAHRHEHRGLFSVSLFVSYLLRIFFVLIEFVLLLRVILRLFAASPNAGFVSWVYATSQPLVAPFNGIFPNAVIEGAFVIDFAAILAMLVYAFVVYLATELIDYLGYQSDNYHNHDYEE